LQRIDIRHIVATQFNLIKSFSKAGTSFPPFFFYIQEQHDKLQIKISILLTGNILNKWFSGIYVVIFYCLLLLFVFSGTTASAIKNDPLIAKCDQDYPPFEFNRNGQPDGYNVDLLKSIADVMGLNIKIETGP